MELIPIEVECHSGYKADEYPVSFTWYEKRFEIRKIIDRWFQGDRDPEVPAADYYKVKAHDGGEYILKNELALNCWYLVI
jgi:hypothetical protein